MSKSYPAWQYLAAAALALVLGLTWTFHLPTLLGPVLLLAGIAFGAIGVRKWRAEQAPA